MKKKIIIDKFGIKYLDLDDTICRAIKNNGSFAEDNKRIFLLWNSLLHKRKGAVIDIGANIGTFCLPLAKIFPKISFYTFEVQPKLSEILQFNIELNGIKNIHNIKLGLSNTNRKLNVFLPDYDLEKNLGGFSLSKKKFLHSGRIKNFSNKITKIQVKKLDDIFKNEKIIFIKSDTELHEYEIFKGAIKTLNKNKPFLLFETWPNDRKEFEKNQYNIKKTITFLKKQKYFIIKGYRETFGIYSSEINTFNSSTFIYFFKKIQKYDQIYHNFKYQSVRTLITKLIYQIFKSFRVRLKRLFLF